MFRRQAMISAFVAMMVLSGLAQAEDDIQPSEQSLRIELRFVNRRAGRSNPAAYAPGEHTPIFVGLRGVTVGDDGKIDVLSRVDLLDTAGRTMKTLISNRQNGELPLGGSELSFVLTGALPDGLQGEHSIRVTVEDQVSRRTVTGDLRIVLSDPTELSLVHLRTTIDEQLRLPCDVFPVGKKAFVAYGAGGCAIADGKSAVESTVTVLDASGKPVDAKPNHQVGEAEQPAYATTGRMNGYSVIGLNRAGDFLLQVRVKDKISGKEVTGELPIRVVDGAEWPAEEVADQSDAKPR